MTTFNIEVDKPSLCVDCSPAEAAEFNRVIAEQDRRIRENRKYN